MKKIEENLPEGASGIIEFVNRKGVKTQAFLGNLDNGSKIPLSEENLQLVVYEALDYSQPQTWDPLEAPQWKTKIQKLTPTDFVHTHYEPFIGQLTRDGLDGFSWDELDTPRKLHDLWVLMNDPKQLEKSSALIEDRFSHQLESAWGLDRKKRAAWIEKKRKSFKYLRSCGYPGIAAIRFIHIPDVEPVKAPL